MALLGGFLKSSIKLTSTIQKSRKIKPYKWQKKALEKLVSKARYTQFGEKYDFNNLLNSIVFDDLNEFYEVFKRTVPIHDYNKMYNEWWHRARNGEENVCWPGRIKYFALSSGTSEAASKTIPVTKDMIKAIQKTSINQIIALGNYKGLPSKLYEKNYLMLGGSTKLNDVDRHFEGDLSGITTGTIPFWFERFYKPGRRISQLKNWEKKLEEITDNAKDWDIGFIAGVPAWIQLLLERIIERYKLNHIHEIWPNLSAFAWGGVSFDPYKKGFERLLGKPILYMETYLASEGFLAYQVRPEAGLQMVLNNGIFFEFIPFTEKNFDEDGNLTENPETYMINEVKEGIDYALLISTCSGAWRYLIGDTIRFTNLEKVEILITGRTKHFLSLCGEHMSVDNMNKAIDLATKYFGISVKEFTVAGIKHPPLFAHQWYVGTDDEVDEAELARFIDEKIKEINDDYTVERQHALKNVFCKVLPEDAFYGWMRSRGKIGGQSKFPRVIKGDALEDWNKYIQANYSGVKE